MPVNNKMVIHQTWGEGIITNMDDKYITVFFASQQAEKKFAYPDAFEKYLVYKDEVMQTADLEQVAVKRDHEHAEKEEHTEKQQQEIAIGVKDDDKRKDIIDECDKIKRAIEELRSATERLKCLTGVENDTFTKCFWGNEYANVIRCRSVSAENVHD